MNLTNDQLELPAGLVDEASEFFTIDHFVDQVHNGAVIQHNDLPSFFYDLLVEAIDNDPQAKAALIDWGLYTEEEQVMQYYRCNYSGYDLKPDVTTCGKLGPREYVKCGRRGICDKECKLCKLPLGLTKREVEVIQLIGLGLRDKEICDRLCFTQDTLRSHKDNVSGKTGKQGKPELAVLAKELNLI